MMTAAIIASTAALAILAAAAAIDRRAAGLAARLAHLARAVVQLSYKLACGSALLLVLVQIAAVVAVSVFAISVVWLQELTAYLFGAMFLFGAGGVLLRDGHVRVDVFSSRWTNRRRAKVDLAGFTLFVLPVCALVLIVALPWAARSWAELERSQEPSGLHLVFVLKSMVPAFGVLLALAAFVRAEGAARLLRRRC